MMATTTAIMEMSDAVQGIPSNFDHLEVSFSELGSQVRQIESDLSGVRFGTSGEFAGQAANSFASRIAEIDNQMYDLGNICYQVGTIFGQHARRLKLLEKEAANALARAQTAWDRRVDAERDLVAADRSIDFFRGQLDSLSNELDEGERRRIEWKLDCAYDERADAAGRESSADRDLECERQAWRDLRTSEESLIDETASRLLSVDLESLADPSAISQVFNKIGEVKDWLSENYKELLAAVYKSLEHLQTILLVAILVVAAIVLVVGSGGTLGVVLLPALITALKIVSVAKAVSGVAAWIADPENISGPAVLLDVVAAFVLPAASKSHAFTDTPMTKFLISKGVQPVTALKVWDASRTTIHFVEVAEFAYGAKNSFEEVVDFVHNPTGVIVQPAESSLSEGLDPLTCVEGAWRTSSEPLQENGDRSPKILISTGWK